ncbi:UNVERIFIED_CONTAM: putative sugar phosphate/phosphate translocator [Sesamum radiatum]|uniref:Sugar phosphate/phosphate translocator n=1 Tax=Sesamum radiatum TaxID=300843 RepID=A0AAW2KZK6_SESRA
MPVAVYTIGIMFKKDSYKNSTMFNMLGISVGVAIAAYGEAKYDSWGVFLQLGAVVFEATRLVMIQILLTSKGISLNPITSLYYVAPSCLAFLAIPWLFVEYPLLKQQSSGFHFDFVIFGTNFSVCLCIELGCVLVGGKDFSFDHECCWGCQGLVVDCFLLALKAKEAQKKAQPEDEESGKLLDQREGDGMGEEREIHKLNCRNYVI